MKNLRFMKNKIKYNPLPFPNYCKKPFIDLIASTHVDSLK